MPGLKRHQTRLRSSVPQQGNANASTSSAPGSRSAPPPAASTSRQPAPPRQQQRLASETPSTSNLGGSIDRGGTPAVGGPPFPNEGGGGAFGAMAAHEARDAYGEGNEEEEDGLGLSHKVGCPLSPVSIACIQAHDPSFLPSFLRHAPPFLPPQLRLTSPSSSCAIHLSHDRSSSASPRGTQRSDAATITRQRGSSISSRMRSIRANLIWL